MNESTKLTLELYRYEQIVFGKCKYLENSLKGTGALTENKRFQISSDVEPAIVVSDNDKTKLNVWGNNLTANDQAFYHAFDDAESAEEFTLNITRLYNKLNGTNTDVQLLVKVL